MNLKLVSPIPMFIKKLLTFFILFYCIQAQSQTCPINFSYSTSDLSHWFAFTGDFDYGNTQSRKTLFQVYYDSILNYPQGTVNAKTIPEYGRQNTGIEVQTTNSLDYFGNFPTIPTINGYNYNYSIKLGSTTINNNDPAPNGGLFRKIGYTINVPPGLATDPYVITYAYAMVLESAPHASDEVPQFKAILNSQDGSTINCADASYILPTQLTGTRISRGTVVNIYNLDQQAALNEGFTQSPNPSPNVNNGNTNENLYRVWTKDWTEVLIDLKRYRGTKVTLTFEADNCVPSGHFAYAYVALKNVCQGLQIEGNPLACPYGNATYSIPELNGGSYLWSIPNNWQPTPTPNSNKITVTPDLNGGVIGVTATINGCDTLTAQLNVALSPPTIPGKISGDTSICIGFLTNQGIPLTLSGNSGNILGWISSVDGGKNWNNIANTSPQLTVNNLAKTTMYQAIVQNGPACKVDTTAAAIIALSPKPIAGKISPDSVQICMNQPLLDGLTLLGSTGSSINWQSSTDLLNWGIAAATSTSSILNITGINKQTFFRAIVSDPGCPADTSNQVKLNIFPANFPEAVLFPKDTTICFGTVAFINAAINNGSSYQWVNPGSIYNGGNGIISGLPFLINAQATPSKNTNYILRVSNAGCPNSLFDTIHVNVLSPLSVNAGRDTSILINQPLQINAILSDQRLANYLWTPPTGLNNIAISNPIAILDGSQDQIRYFVTVTDSVGCSATNSFLVTILKNGPQIFVPTGFTPNADGKNDVLRPTVYGITQKYFFSVFNRWGQQIFFSTQIGMGWDGTFNGIPQPAGAYVFIAEGEDYLGKRIISKGTAVLIR